MRLETTTLIVMGAATAALAFWDIYAKIKQTGGKRKEKKK